MKQLKVENFSLEHTLECGQVFRFNKANGFYFLVVRDKAIKLKQENHCLYFSGVNEKFIRRYFRLDEDYETIISILKKDKIIARTIKQYYGLRLCRQDPWECLISFICSTWTNIPNIKRTVEKLAGSFGNKISNEDFESYSFPSPVEINNLCAIQNCGCGFRSKRIFETSKTTDEKKLALLKKLDYKEAKKELKKLPGVGEKVADCTLLFSLGFDEAFPIDTWIKRQMEKHYFGNKNTSIKKIREFAMNRFGKYAGYAQQFLFFSGIDTRNKKIRK